MQGISNSIVDMYESLPVPFGLVRYGVAPDHPEVKNCQDKFTEVASSPNFNFIGNVRIGQDVSLKTLANRYDAILFAYGASKDRKLGIPGEDTLQGIYAARDFVGWYNGLPEFSSLSPRLDTSDTAVIIGQGNVALDIARTLLKGVDTLRHTDMSEQALETLSTSRVKRVHVVGRRGPMQIACTIKEVRELMNLPSVTFKPIGRKLLPPDLSTLPRTARRLTKLLLEGSYTPVAEARKSWSLDFLLSPVRFVPGQPNHLLQVKAIDFQKMQFAAAEDKFAPAAKVQAAAGEELTSISTSLAFRSIGYQSEPLPGMSELGIRFDEERGIITNDDCGRLISPSEDGDEARTLPGLYCAGWVKRGPTGVIANTMEDSFATAEAIIADWGNEAPFLAGGGGWDSIKTDLAFNGEKAVSWEDWLKIDAAEKSRGKLLGKEREKLTSPQDMLGVLD
ncbi:MAG: hypothetical protein Q9207_001931 [Kuettlingeria erythrocarpa]